MTNTDELMRKLFSRLQEVKAENERLKQGVNDEPIAIIGIGCRLPGGANSLSEFAHQLAGGVDWVTRLPDERACFKADAEPHWRSSLLDHVEQFDANFFDLTQTEAADIDPQQRLLLEVAYHALEDARYPANQLRGRDVGVFIGMSTDDYQAQTIGAQREGAINPYSALGTARSIAAGRIAYTFDFTGPVLQVDTACSSSLMAIHLACQSLRQREACMALAGGVTLNLSAETYMTRDAVGALSPTGKCHTFSADADGYARGEGCGLVVLKRLSEALDDEDHIHAVIYASTVNHDGHSNGLTAPNGEAQRQLMRNALFKAGLRPEELDYVETHGTGTRLGDPIEVHAIGDVLVGNREVPLWLGSLKSQIGHLEAAAGVASVIKTCALLASEMLLPGAPIKQLNPLIDWDKYHLRVVDAPVPWPRQASHSRRAAVNAFGLSGTNVNLILGDPPEVYYRNWADASTIPTVLCVSGKTQASYLRNLHVLQQELRQQVPLEAVALASCLFKEPFAYRKSFVADDLDAVIRAMEAAKHELVAPNSPGAMAYCFEGEGWTLPAMTALYNALAAFKREVDNCLSLCAGKSVDLSWLETSPLVLGQTVVALIGEYALSKTWLALGVKPTLLACRGLGLLPAACLAGLISPAQMCGLEPLWGDSAADAARLLVAKFPLQVAAADAFVALDKPSLTQIALLAKARYVWPSAAALPVKRLLYLSSAYGGDFSPNSTPRAEREPDSVANTPAYAFAASVARLFDAGVNLDFAQLYAVPRAAISNALPGYRFDTKALWTASHTARPATGSDTARLLYQTHWMACESTPEPNIGRMLVLGNSSVNRVLETRAPHGAVRLFDHDSEDEMRSVLLEADGPADVFDLRFFEPAAEFAYDACLNILSMVVKTVQGLAAYPNVRYHLVVHGERDTVPLGYAPLAGFMRAASHEHPGLVASFASCTMDALPSLLPVLTGVTAFEHFYASAQGIEVLRLSPCAEPLFAEMAAIGPLLDDGAIWITGGLGGLGLELAKKLAHFGARDILLTSRRTDLNLESALALAEIRAFGARVHIESLDIGNERAVFDFTARLGVDLPRVADIVHAAGVSEYCSVADLTPERLDHICAAKVRGAWHLHLASQNLNLRNLIFYSSISSVWGSVGLSHYAAANAFLDALAQHRVATGQPATVINWGPWARVGMAAREGNADMTSWGLIPLESDELDDVIRVMFVQPGWSRVVCDLDLPRFRDVLESRHAVPLLDPVFLMLGEAVTVESAPLLNQTRPFCDLPAKARGVQIADTVAGHIAALLNLPNPSAIARSAPLHELGVDSLMAVSLTRKLSQFFGQNLPATLIFDHPTIAAIAEFIQRTVYGRDDDELSDKEEAALLALLNGMSLDEIDMSLGA